MKPLRPTKKTGLDKRNEIIESARVLFAETNPEDLILDHVAKHAGVAKGTLYLYFKDKSDLIRGVIEDTMQKAESEITRKTRTLSDPVEKLKVRLHIFLRYADENHEFFFRYCNPHLLQSSDSGTPPNGMIIAITRIEELIRQVAKEHSLEVKNPRMTALFFMSLGRTALLEKAIFKGTWSLETRFHELFKLFSRGIGLSVSSMKAGLLIFLFSTLVLSPAPAQIAPAKNTALKKQTPVPIPVDAFDLKTWKSVV